jgi:uncharacterized protein YfiM (DUF2279 family)
VNAVWLAIQLACGLGAGATPCAVPGPPFAFLAGAEFIHAAEPPQGPPPDRWFGTDKLQHFALSYAITSFTFAGVQAAGAEGDARLHLAAGVALLAGLGKEVADSRRNWGFSVKDLIYDALGIAAAWVVLERAR